MDAAPRLPSLRSPRTPLADRPVAWVALAVLGSAACGLLAYQDARLLLDVGLVAAAIFAFLRWPYLLLLLVLLVAAVDNQTLELATLIGGGVAVALGGRRVLRSPVAISFAVLLLLAVRELPLHPAFADGARPAELYLPGVGWPYLGTPSNALIAWWRLAFVLVAFALGAWLIRDRKRLLLAVAAVLVGAVYPVAVGLQQWVTGDLVAKSGSDTKAVEGPFTFPNYFAFYLLSVLVIGTVALIETRDKRLRVAIGGLLVAALTCFVLTYTRSAWIGFAGALALLGLLRYRWLIPVGLIAVATAIVAFPSSVDSVSARFGDLSSQSPEHSTSSWVWRTGQWKRMIPRGLEHPLAGTGFGSYEAETVKEFGFQTPEYLTLQDPHHPDASPKGFTAHNDYVRMLVELGIPGVTLWALVLLLLLAGTWRYVRAPGVGPYAAGVTVLVAAIVGVSFADNIQAYTADLLVPFVLAGGVATVARNQLRARFG